MKLNKLLKFLGYKQTVDREPREKIEDRVKNTNFVKIWLTMPLFVCFGMYLITVNTLWLLIAILTMSYMNSLHISEKQDILLLEIRK